MELHVEMGVFETYILNDSSLNSTLNTYVLHCRRALKQSQLEF